MNDKLGRPNLTVPAKCPEELRAFLQDVANHLGIAHEIVDERGLRIQMRRNKALGVIEYRDDGRWPVTQTAPAVAASVSNEATPEAVSYPVNVRDLGAVGDGIHDDTSALQLAINTFADIYLPPGLYRVTTPLNMTGYNHGNRHIYGGGYPFGKPTVYSVGAVIVGDTGGVVFDCTGSQFLLFERFSIISGESNPSTCGFLFARSDVSMSMMHRLDQLYIELTTDATANGNEGTVAIYNYAAECFHAQDCYLSADTAFFASANNDWSMTSSYATMISGTSSCSQIKLSGGVFNTTDITRRCIYLNTVLDSAIRDIYLMANEAGGIGIEMRGGCRNTHATGISIEVLKHIAMLGNGISECSIHAKKYVSDDIPFLRAPDENPDYIALGNVVLEVINFYATPTAEAFYDGKSTDALIGCEFIANYCPPKWSDVGSNAVDCRYTVNGITTYHGSSAPPTTGPYAVGSLRWNTAPDVDTTPGWICVSCVETDVRVQIDAGQFLLQVDSTTGMLADDVIGVVLDNGAIHWTTIAGVVDADTLTITAAIPANRYGAVGASVYTNRWKAMANLQELDCDFRIGSGTAITKHLSSTTTWDPGTVADGAVASTTVTVTGAALGDTVAVGLSVAVVAGVVISGAVTSANTVTVTAFNHSGGNWIPGSGTLRADIWQH